MTDPKRDLDDALRAVEKLKKKEQPATRHHARAVLVPLGMLVLDGSPDAEPAAARIRALVPDVKSWDKAVLDELTLACTEHAQGVDPRFLDHPRFDFTYVVTARERLEARFRALEALEMTLDEDLLQRVSRADAMLAPYLEAREGRQSGN